MEVPFNSVYIFSRPADRIFVNNFGYNFSARVTRLSILVVDCSNLDMEAAKNTSSLKVIAALLFLASSSSARITW